MTVIKPTNKDRAKYAAENDELLKKFGGDETSQEYLNALEELSKKRVDNLEEEVIKGLKDGSLKLPKITPKTSKKK
jgi:hypothetical protein